MIVFDSRARRKLITLRKQPSYCWTKKKIRSINGAKEQGIQNLLLPFLLGSFGILIIHESFLICERKYDTSFSFSILKPRREKGKKNKNNLNLRVTDAERARDEPIWVKVRDDDEG